VTAPVSAPSERPARPLLWAALFAFNMALIAAAWIFEWIEYPAPLILIALNMGLVVKMAREARRRQEQKGAMSPALRTYNRRVLTAFALYGLAMIGGGTLYDRLQPEGLVLWLLALAPLAPLLGAIWAMVRYYRDEDDEFLRHRAVVGALVGLLLVLVLGTTWGFLEMYGLVPHVWNWWVFPIWAVGLGIGTCLPTGPAGDEQ
jgi:hypothetical protein